VFDNKRPVILVVDDEPKSLDILADILKHQGYKVLLAATGQQAIDTVAANPVDLILLDLRLPDIHGSVVLERIKKTHPLLPIVIISGHGTIPIAVNTTQKGAADFIEKPLDTDQVLDTINRVLTKSFAQQEATALSAKYQERYGMVGAGAKMRRVYEIIEKAAPTDASILIHGESGTGKELLAKAVHKSSPRSLGPYIKLNCAAIPVNLIESELFGYMKGAFTGALYNKEGKFFAAHGGTLFLDEIGDMDLSTQSKVLRALQEKEIQPVGSNETIPVDIRLIAATHKNLREEIKKETFRQDLFYRINVVSIEVPPLRERKEDIPLLVDHFLTNFCDEYNRKRKRVSPQAMEILLSRDWWENNVRELRNVIEKIVVLVDDELITPSVLQIVLEIQELEYSMDEPISLHEARERFERELIRNKLIANNWNISAASKMLGIERTNLHRKMKALGIKGQS